MVRGGWLSRMADGVIDSRSPSCFDVAVWTARGLTESIGTRAAISADRQVQPMIPSADPPPYKLTLSADEVAALLGVSRAKVDEAIHEGELPNIRFGRR